MIPQSMLAQLNQIAQEYGIIPTCPWTEKDAGNPDSVLVAFGRTQRAPKRTYILVYSPHRKDVDFYEFAFQVGVNP